jgi:hypothetical protein
LALLLLATFTASHQPLLSSCLITSRCLPLLLPLLLLPLIGCHAVVCRLLLSLHAIVQPLTLLLPAVFDTSRQMLPSCSLATIRRLQLPLPKMVD